MIKAIFEDENISYALIRDVRNVAKQANFAALEFHDQLDYFRREIVKVRNCFTIYRGGEHVALHLQGECKRSILVVEDDGSEKDTSSTHEDRAQIAKAVLDFHAIHTNRETVSLDIQIINFLGDLLCLSDRDGVNVAALLKMAQTRHVADNRCINKTVE